MVSIMAPCSYMLWVNSQPLTVDDDTWVKMYTTEHAADTVTTKMAEHARYNRAVRPPIGPLSALETYHPLNYVATSTCFTAASDITRHSYHSLD